MEPADLAENLAAEWENIEATLADLRMALNESPRTRSTVVAMASYIGALYNGIENLLKQVLKCRGIVLPRSESWHKELLEIGFAQQLLPEVRREDLFNLLGFRHFLHHAYGFMIKEEQVIALAVAVEALCRDIRAKITQ